MNRSTTTAPTRASRARSAAFAAALLLAACGTYGPGSLRPGQSEAEARAQLGEPSTRAALPNGGTRLDYGRGPYGAHTWRVELDGSGKVASVSQLLTENNFETLRPGWSKQQVLDAIGPPSELRRPGWRGSGEVWSYRYDWRVRCQWFQVWMVDERVREAGYSLDPQCEEARKVSAE